jgi:hypothetical protein
VGELHGWDEELPGGLVEIGPDFYRLEVPSDGATTIAQVIAATEAAKRRGCFPLAARAHPPSAVVAACGHLRAAVPFS